MHFRLLCSAGSIAGPPEGRSNRRTHHIRRRLGAGLGGHRTRRLQEPLRRRACGDLALAEEQGLQPAGSSFRGRENSEGASTFNAKAETLSERPAYRNAFLKRRCIVPAEAFYEWVGPKKERQPLNIRRADGKLLSMAGLFNYWKPTASQGRPMLTFTVVTTAPSQWMARIHNRMPVILQDNHIDAWLDPTISDPQQLSELLKAPPEDFLDCYAISRQINSVKFDEPEYAKEIALDYRPLLQIES